MLSFAILAAVKKKISVSRHYKDTILYFARDFPGGLSLSYIIFLNCRYVESLDVIKHEYGHSRQSLMLGWLYLPVVGLPSLIRSIIWNIKKLGENDYYSKFPENWANRLGGHSVSTGSNFNSSSNSSSFGNGSSGHRGTGGSC